MNYIGRVCGKNGNTLFKSRPHPTRELCAAECFEAKPRAKSCSTNEIKLETRGGIQYVIDAGRDIRWHNRA